MDVPHHHRDVSAASDVLICNIILLVAITIAISIRLYTRLIVIKHPGVDDLLATISYVLATAELILMCVATKYGLGKHIEYVSEPELEEMLRIDYAMELLYITAFISIKMSFVCLYLRIFPHRIFRMINYSLLVFLAAQMIEEFFVVIFQCWPVHKAWEPWAPGKCLHMLPFFYTSFGVKLVTDLAIFIMPIPMMKGANMPRTQYYGVLAMFTLGFFVCVVSIIRATYLKNTSTDVTWLLVNELNWTSIEVGIAIVAACIPALKTFFMQFPSLRKTLGLGGSTGQSSNDHYEMKTTTRPMNSHLHSRYDRHERILEDGESEEDIMPNASEPGHGDITVTTKWSIVSTPNEEK